MATTTLDDVFQRLIAQDVPALMARRQITKMLQLGKLLVDFHIAAGTRKTQPRRRATAEELAAVERAQADFLAANPRATIKDRTAVLVSALDFLYERTPPEGITAKVAPQSWDIPLFAVTVRDGHLMVEPRCALDFPWLAYTFTVANPVVIPTLFPPPSPPASVEPKATRAAEDDPRDAAMKKRYEAGQHPGRGGTVAWEVFAGMIRRDCNASEGGEGFSIKTLRRRFGKLGLK
jgi:hypothetical protein